MQIERVFPYILHFIYAIVLDLGQSLGDALRVSHPTDFRYALHNVFGVIQISGIEGEPDIPIELVTLEIHRTGISRYRLDPHILQLGAYMPVYGNRDHIPIRPLSDHHGAHTSYPIPHKQENHQRRVGGPAARPLPHQQRGVCRPAGRPVSRYSIKCIRAVSFLPPPLFFPFVLFPPNTFTCYRTSRAWNGILLLLGRCVATATEASLIISYSHALMPYLRTTLRHPVRNSAHHSLFGTDPI